MGRNWRPKSDVRCLKCGWTGKRVATAKACPRCGHYKPVIVTDKEKAARENAAGIDVGNQA